jgi:hypothetical protein
MAALQSYRRLTIFFRAMLGPIFTYRQSECHFPCSREGCPSSQIRAGGARNAGNRPVAAMPDRCDCWRISRADAIWGIVVS